MRRGEKEGGGRREEPGTGQAKEGGQNKEEVEASMEEERVVGQRKVGKF